jgi:hypothetical protein
VHLDADLDVGGGGAGLNVLPERYGHLLPLVVEDVEVLAVPRVDDPVRGLVAGLPGGQAGHGHDPLHAEQRGHLDGAAQVLRVLRPDGGVRVERVAVDVQAGQRDPGLLEAAQVVLAGAGAGQDVVDRDVRCGDEAARVDLCAGQAQLAEDLEGLVQGTVVQAGGVRAELHGGVLRSIGWSACRWPRRPCRGP